MSNVIGYQREEGRTEVGGAQERNSIGMWILKVIGAAEWKGSCL